MSLGSDSTGDDLLAVLRRSQRLGYIGGSDLDPHIDHAIGFAGSCDRPPVRALDLGSGGGLPGLVLARHWPESSWLLLDGSQTRTTFLDHAVRELELGDRVTVLRARAEDAGHESELRGAFDLVVARSFGPPAVVAECAAPFLAVGGRLVVSEPPDVPDRWSHPDALADLGLELGAVRSREPGALGQGTYQSLEQVAPCPARYPRRVGVPTKRPLFGA